MLNERYYNRDAGMPFLAPESIDLFVTHPPYFNLNSEAYGNPEGQLQNTGDREVFINKIIDVIKNMEMALKPTGTILIGFPTDPNIYKIIEKINDKKIKILIDEKFDQLSNEEKEKILNNEIKQLSNEEIEQILNKEIEQLPKKYNNLSYFYNFNRIGLNLFNKNGLNKEIYKEIKKRL